MQCDELSAACAVGGSGLGAEVWGQNGECFSTKARFCSYLGKPLSDDVRLAASSNWASFAVTRAS
jgi:hypothetical protein